jgi:hypothetical protein
MDYNISFVFSVASVVQKVEGVLLPLNKMRNVK